MTQVLHILYLIPRWPIAIWMLGATRRRLKADSVSLPRVSARWLLEFEVASGKHQDE